MKKVLITCGVLCTIVFVYIMYLVNSCKTINRDTRYAKIYKGR